MSDLARPVMAEIPLTDHCPRCCTQEPVFPVAELFRGAEVRHVYECPRCQHAWWVGRGKGPYTGWPQGAAA